MFPSRGLSGLRRRSDGAPSEVSTIAGGRSRVRGGYEVFSIDAPATTAAQRQTLLRPLIAASSAAFGVDTSAAWQDRLEAGWFDRITRLVLITDRRGDVVGWTSYRRVDLAGRRVLYMDTTGIVPEHQRHRLIPRIQSRLVLRTLAARPWHSLYVVYRTRNPVVWRGLRRTIGRSAVAPPLHGDPPAWARAVATAVHSHLAEPGELDARTLAVRGAYARRGAALYGESETPRSGDPDTDRYFDERLGPSDAFFIVVRATLPRVIAAGRR